MNFTILRFETIGSTNTEALRQTRIGAAEGLCVIAHQQTAGRGRHGRVWISEKDAGLYFSIVLRPKVEMRFLPLVTLMTAVVVHDTLEDIYDFECDIKWANDIHTRGKKICGILAETCESEAGLAVVVGIGINLKHSNFPAELTKIATAIEDETRRPVNFDQLLQTLTRQFANYYQIFQASGGAEKIRQIWTEKSSYSFGKAVRIWLENETVCGMTRGIEADGALRVETESGEIKVVRAGDVEKLRQN